MLIDNGLKVCYFITSSYLLLKTTGDFMIKRLLFTCIALLFFVSVPYDVFAAPRKETKKERRERLKREEAARKRRQKTPPQKKITPTLEEKLSPAQVTRKIQTIRKRIETAPASTIPAKYKRILLEVFDDMIQTQIGRYVFEKSHPDLNFCVRNVTGAASYSPGRHCINIDTWHFENIYKTTLPEKIASSKLSLASSIAHEATHSIQHVNNMTDRRNMSFEEMITIHKLFELHACLNESISSYQVSKLPAYRHMHPKSNKYRTQAEALPGEMSILPQHIFYKELKDAKMETGVDEKNADRFARTKYVEYFWSNKTIPLQVGNKTINLSDSHVDGVIQAQNRSYNAIAYKRLPYGKVTSTQIMSDKGIKKNIQRFIDVMQIDTPVSFFRDPKTTPFNVPTASRVVCYLNGIKNTEYDNLTTGFIVKGYDKEKLSEFGIVTNQKKSNPEDKTYTEYHEGTRIKKSTYTYKNGKMNGVYREYDRQGRQILEIPVENDKAHGEGWSWENGMRVVKKFRRGYCYKK